MFWMVIVSRFDSGCSSHRAAETLSLPIVFRLLLPCVFTVCKRKCVLNYIEGNWTYMPLFHSCPIKRGRLTKLRLDYLLCLFGCLNLKLLPPSLFPPLLRTLVLWKPCFCLLFGVFSRLCALPLETVNEITLRHFW